MRGALLADLKHARRAAARAKGSTAVVVLSLALGTGANAVIYSVLDVLLFRGPAGVPHQERLVQVFTGAFNGMSRGSSSHPDFESLRAEASAFESLAAFDDSAHDVVRLTDEGHRVRIAAVTGGFFPTLGLTAAAGHLPEWDDRGVPPLAVISARLWGLFGRPADIAGRTISIGGREYRVAGVAPARFTGLQLARVTDVWIPWDGGVEGTARGDRRLSLIGRLRHDADVADAQEDAQRVSTRLAEQYPATNRGTRSGDNEPRLMTAEPYSWIEPAAQQRVLLAGLVIFGAALLLLTSAVVNAASVLLSRTAARRRDLAVMTALGATRTALVRQALAEGLSIALAGTALGVLTAYWTARALPALFSPDHAEMLDVSFDWTLIGGSAALACLTGAVFAIAPAWQIIRTAGVEALRSDAAGIAERAAGLPLRPLAVVGQICLSTVLLMAAVLLVRALNVALDAGLGADVRGVAIALIRPPGDLEGNMVRSLDYQARAQQLVRAIPGAGSTGIVATLPLGRSASSVFRVSTQPGVTETIGADVNFVSRSYFGVFRMPILEGRGFEAGDGPRSKLVVVVNEVLARRYFFPLAMGQRLLDSTGTELEIVGVVRSDRHRTLQQSPEPAVYFPLSQRAYYGPLHLVVRTDSDPAVLLPSLEATLRSAGPVQILRMTTLEAHLAESLTLDRVATTLVATCAVWALLLATAGVYNVVGDAVRRRTPEIGL
ncbi:MAG TPA: ABC transporter permease, partial [Vicinamibacterales bacterium]|nr:ABC transporter permease [Vicinamibacterales bacterium]